MGVGAPTRQPRRPGWSRPGKPDSHPCGGQMSSGHDAAHCDQDPTAVPYNVDGVY
jgi:hypothetical protein